MSVRVLVPELRLRALGNLQIANAEHEALAAEAVQIGSTNCSSWGHRFTVRLLVRGAVSAQSGVLVFTSGTIFYAITEGGGVHAEVGRPGAGPLSAAASVLPHETALLILIPLLVAILVR